MGYVAWSGILLCRKFWQNKNVIADFTDSSQALTKATKLFKNSELLQQLVFLRTNYSFVSKIISELEENNLPLVNAVGLVEKFTNECKNVKGEIGKKFIVS